MRKESQNNVYLHLSKMAYVHKTKKNVLEHVP